MLHQLKTSYCNITASHIEDARSDAVTALKIDERKTKAEIKDLKEHESENKYQLLVDKYEQLTNLLELEKQQKDDIEKLVKVQIHHMICIYSIFIILLV